MQSLPARLTLFGAQLEAHLTTHAFTVLFTSIYLLALFLMFVLGFYTEYVEHVGEVRPVVLWFLSLARGTGYTLNLNTPFILLLSSRLFLTGLRNSPLSNILPLDSAFPAFHIVAGYTILASVFFHGSFHLTWISISNAWEPGIFGFTMSVATGFCLLAVLIIIVFVARPLFRSKHFRIFRLIHVGAAFLFFILLIFHGMFNQKPETYKWITPVIILYAFDRILRRIKATSTVLSLTADNADLDGNILVLRIPRPFDFRAGQYAEIQVPSINIEWHPFTIASAPHEEQSTFFIKIYGDWTGKLRDELQSCLQGEQGQPLKVIVRGPFGAPSQHVEGYERVVLVSGGVGSTPFAAICKDLHHKNIMENLSKDAKEEHSDHDNMILAKYDERVRVAISKLYNVDTHDAFKLNEEDEQKSIFVTDMLNIAGDNADAESPSDFTLAFAPSHSSRPLSVDPSIVREIGEASYERVDSTFTFESESSYNLPKDHHYLHQKLPRKTEGSKATKSSESTLSSEDEEDVLQKLSVTARLQQKKRQKLTHMYEGKAKLLALLHTTRVQFFSILILLARFTVAGVASVLSKKKDMIVTWLAIADAPMAIILAIVVFLTIMLELSFMGWQYFADIGRCIDTFAFVPLVLGSAAVGIRVAIEGTYKYQIISILQYAVVLPQIFILLIVRLHRSVRLHSLLTKYIRRPHPKSAPDIDFIWTTREEDDDNWLRKELSPLAYGTDLRLHRYVTRTKEVDVEAGADVLAFSHSGRPEWNKIFQKLAASAPSRSVIGVFFCGPRPMGAAVQAALRRAEVTSHLRAAYLSKTPQRTLVSDLGVPRGFMVRKLQKRGCSVRFVFREENFS